MKILSCPNANMFPETGYSALPDYVLTWLVQKTCVSSLHKRKAPPVWKVVKKAWMMLIDQKWLWINIHVYSSLPLCVLQLLSDSQINMVKVVNSVSDALNAMQKENVGLKARVKADLQRAPVRGARLKGCSNGKRNEAWLAAVLIPVWFFLCRLVYVIFSLSLCLCIFNSYWLAVWPSAIAFCSTLS